MSYTPTPGPAMEGSIADDPPPYSACVPYPPPINSNCPETHSSLPVKPSAPYSPGFQTGIRPHDAITNAPLLDVRSTLQNYPNVYNPTVTPDNVGPPASNHSTQTNPPIHIHRTKILTLQRNPNSAGRSGNSVKMCAAGVFCIVMTFIVIATVTLRHINRNKNDKYNEIVKKLKNDYSATSESPFRGGSPTFQLNKDDIFKVMLGEDEYDKFMKKMLESTNTDKDREINRNHDDLRKDGGMVHHDSLQDELKKDLNDLRKERNMATLSPNMNYNEMFQDTLENLFFQI